MSLRKTKSFTDQLTRIKRAAQLAQERTDYVTAHDEDILHAIDIVEAFLRKKHRICYGGQAINAHLPEKYKVYNPEQTIPDYDFFSPQQDADLRYLVQEFKKAGFTEISAREGMHEGTIKVYVNYIPVADITAVEPSLYRLLARREYRYDGISYMDIHTLRMMMYLELSRPRGEVERWPKVYERLLLLNAFTTKKSCTLFRTLSSHLTKEKVERVLQWVITHRRVFAGLDLVDVYRQSLQKRSKKMEWLIHTRKPILFYSPDPQADAEKLRTELQLMDRMASASTASSTASTATASASTASSSTSSSSSSKKPSYRIRTESKKSELLPTLTILYDGKTPLVFIVHQTACHSYFQLPLTNNRNQEMIRIASVDTLITLYFSLGLLDHRFLDIHSMECIANQLVQLSIQMRSRPASSPFPFISLNCAGHQTTLPSLIRAKVKRVTERKKHLEDVMMPIGKNRGKETRSTLRSKINRWGL